MTYCKYSYFDAVNILSQFPLIRDVVMEYEEATLLSADSLEFRDFGLCRNSGKGNISYFKVDGKILKLPSVEINPEAMPLAKSYQASKENYKLFQYSKENKELTICFLNLPTLIERVLNIASYYEDRIENGNKIYPNISIKIVNQLNRIFLTKTELLDE